jgi:hypothetical protein
MQPLAFHRLETIPGPARIVRCEGRSHRAILQLTEQPDQDAIRVLITSRRSDGRTNLSTSRARAFVSRA